VRPLEKTEYKLALGRRVRHLRKMHQLTQSQLAFESEVSRNLIIKLEKGEGNITVTTLLKLCGTLSIEPYKLLDLGVTVLVH